MKNLFLFVSVIGLSIAFTSCTKDSVSTSSSASTSKSTSTTSTGSTSTEPETTVSTTNAVNLQGNWAVVSDSSFWSGELPKALVSTYQGKSGDSFSFSKDGKLYIHEEAILDTPTYSVNTSYMITVVYQDANHFNESPGFSLKLDPIGYNPTISTYFTQKSVDANTLILSGGIGTPGGAAFRVIHLKKIL